VIPPTRPRVRWPSLRLGTVLRTFQPVPSLVRDDLFLRSRATPACVRLAPSRPLRSSPVTRIAKDPSGVRHLSVVSDPTLTLSRINKEPLNMSQIALKVTARRATAPQIEKGIYGQGEVDILVDGVPVARLYDVTLRYSQKNSQYYPSFASRRVQRNNRDTGQPETKWYDYYTVFPGADQSIRRPWIQLITNQFLEQLPDPTQPRQAGAAGGQPHAAPAAAPVAAQPVAAQPVAAQPVYAQPVAVAPRLSLRWLSP